METERGFGTSTTAPSDAVGRTVESFERAGGVMKDAFDKTREKVAEYQAKGFEQVSAEVAEYTRSQPVPALLIAAGVGLLLGVMLGRGQR